MKMDSVITGQMQGEPLNDSENDEGECHASEKDRLEEVTVKKETESDLEKFIEVVKEEARTDFPVVKELTKEEIMTLEDFEFRSVGPSTSTEICNYKAEDYDVDDSQEEEMNCPVATDGSASEKDPLELSYNMHENIFEHHSKEKIKKLTNNEPEGFVGSHRKVIYRCGYCLKMFDKGCDLKDHLLLLHTGERPYYCNHCEKSFSNVFVWKCHLSIHTEKKKFKCSHCQRSFSLLSSLTNHLKIHSEEKRFICTHCEKSFSILSHLKKHIRLHTGEKPFTCEYCQRSFSDISYLKRHLRTHTGEKPFTCEFCQKSFSLRSSLTNHLRRHPGGGKPYICEHCQRSFSSWFSLNNHLKIH